MTEPNLEPTSLRRVSRIAGVLPWLAVLAFLLAGFYVRFTFGRWPRVYRDSPSFPFTNAAAVVAVIAALSWPVMMSLALGLPMVRRSLRARPVFNRWVLSSGAGAVILYLLCKADPYGFLEWALD